MEMGCGSKNLIEARCIAIIHEVEIFLHGLGQTREARMANRLRRWRFSLFMIGRRQFSKSRGHRKPPFKK
jgi:hypothetical protein